MAESEVFDPPVLQLESAPPMVRVPDPKWRKEREAFHRMLPELLKAHRDQFVAVHEERVVNKGTDPIEVVKRAYAQYGYIPIYVGLVTDQPPPPVRVPSPRLIRRPAR
jgi:hypothetical protein